MRGANGPHIKCRVCGGTLRATTTDLPFKVTERTIVVLKRVPVAQCDRCPEYLIADDVFASVEEFLAKANRDAELEIVPFAS